jgi:hypothetical protein
LRQLTVRPASGAAAVLRTAAAMRPLRAVPLLCGALALGGCHPAPAPAGPGAAPGSAPAAAATMWWSPSLQLPSLQEIPARLERPFEAPIDVAAVASGQQQATSCTSYFALRARGFEAATVGDTAALKVEGTACYTIRALASARPAARGSLQEFRLDPAALAMLPPVMGPQPNPADIEGRRRATGAGKSWAAYDPQARLTASDPARARVTAGDTTTEIEILARADFDGNGTDDLLVSTISYGREGSWREVRLHMLTRAPGSPVLEIAQEISL